MLNKKRKGLSGIALAALVFMGTFNGFYRPDDVYAGEDYHSWRQMDERWASLPIGNTTVGASGCLVTSIAIMAAHSGSVDSDEFNPALFVSALNGIGGFDDYGSLSWSAVTTVVPDVQIAGVNNFQSYDMEGKAGEIRSAMEDGYYVICNVGNHWVFVEGVAENDVYMIDPAKDDVLMFDSYENCNITQYEILTGKNTPSLSFADKNISSAVTTAFTTEPETTTTSEEIVSTTETTTTIMTTDNYVPETTTTEFVFETTTTETVSETTTTETVPETTTTETVPETTTVTTVTEPENTQTTESQSVAEFYYSGEETTSVCTDDGEVIAELNTGNMINVREIRNGYGRVTVDGIDGWIDMTYMVFSPDRTGTVKGDINNDGEINLYDLSLLNEYLKSLKILPDGVSVLSRSEIETADINNDGVTDNGDVLEYLSVICK